MDKPYLSDVLGDRPVVAIAILHQEGRFLMQLRDNVPGILYPGHWGLFGGHVEPDETCDAAIQRELLEEIGYAPPDLNLFGCYEDAKVIRHVYQGALAVDVESLVLSEGADLDLLTPADIVQGDRYSQRIKQTFPLGAPHQRILLDFIQQTQVRFQLQWQDRYD